MRAGTYVIECKSTRNRELIKVRADESVVMYSDLDAHWTFEDVLEYYDFVCRLDLNSFEKTGIRD